MPDFTPQIYVTVDIILTREHANKTEILLIQRLKDPFKDQWALPGGFVDKGEDLETAAKRELEEETSVSMESLAQFKAYGKPDRDPRGHTVSVVFFGKAANDIEVIAQDDAKSVQWYDLEKLPSLAFDHALIIEEYKKRAK